MGLKADVEVGGAIIIGSAVVRVVAKKGSRTRLEITAPKETRIVTGPTENEVDYTVKEASTRRPM
jgi:sRNA-binding carbon storage regulator CsrA